MRCICPTPQKPRTATPLIPVSQSELDSVLKEHPEWVANWVYNIGFKAKENHSCLIPDKEGSILMVLVGVAEEILSQPGQTMWAISTLAKKLT